MSFGTITATESTFGSISGSIVGAVPGTLSGSVGVPGPQGATGATGAQGPIGPQGEPGEGVPTGGTAGQFLTKIDGTNFNTDWTTVNLSAFAVKANNLSDLTSASTARSNLGLGTMATATASDYSTTVVNNGLYYPLTGNPSAFLTSASLSGYLTSATAAATYAPIAAGLPTGGTVGQVLTKNSGTDYDDSWQTLIPGDRYLTTSTTSNSVSNGTKTFTVGTGLSYSSQQDVVISYDAANHMHALVTSYNSGTGVLVVDVQNHTGSGTYTSWTINVGGTTPLQTVEWGEILGVLGDQGDLATALNSKLETSTAASTYAPLAGATFTGEVVTPASTTVSAGLTITPGVAPSAPVNGEIWATSTDLQVRLNGVTETVAEQSWVTSNFYPLTGNPSGFLTSASLSGYALLSGATFTGLVTTLAPTTTTAGFNLPHGTAPTTPVNGDIWTTTSGLFARINGGTQQMPSLNGSNTFNGGTNTFGGTTLTFGNSTAASTINIGTGATLTATTKAINIGTSGVSGSTTNINLGTATGTSTTAVSGTFSAFGNVNLGTSTGATTINVANGATVSASTKSLNLATGGLAGSTTTIAIGSATSSTTTTIEGTVTANGTTLNLGTSTAAATYNLGTGATLTATTKAINIGTNGVAGSTTNIAIGSTAGTSTTTLQGTTNGVTVAADTNSTALATTAYVVGQAGSATPLMDGTAAVGTSLRYARQDHVHPTDTSRAPLASPSLTGTPLAPTAAADTNTTQIATTAFVVGQASATTPANNGTAAIGTSLKYARADHVHPTDTSRAPLASPSLTGTPLAPTAAVDTNTTQIATTAYVVGQGYAKLASPSLTGTPAAPTATAGTNTTQIATTAFVTAAVPSFATTAEIASPSSATKVVAPNDVVRMIVNRASFDTQNSSPTFATSGTGATAYKMTNDRSMQIGTPSVGVAGYGQMIYDTTAGAWGVLGAKRGDNFFTQDWNKRIWMSGTHMFTSIGDANTTAYCMLGGRSSITTGNPTKQAIGWKLVGGGTALKLVTYGYNGTGLVVTETTSSFTPVANQSFDWMIVHAPNVANPATSYCYLYVNDALVATGIYSPADATINYNYFYHSFESTASMATRLDAIVFPVKVWWSKS